MSRSRAVLTLFLIAIILGVLVVLAFIFDILPPQLQAPRVVQIEPASGAREILLTSSITITFSAPMDRGRTETSVEIVPYVTGRYVWRDDQTLVFTATARLPVSTTLTVNIASNARS